MTQKTDNNDPYFHEDPGSGLSKITVHSFDLDKDFHLWKSWRTNDGRVLVNPKCSFARTENPFEPGSLLLLTSNHDPAVTGRSFGGFGMRVPVNPAVEINAQTFVEFQFYYPKSAANKYMRFEIWSTSSGGEGAQANAGSPGTNTSSIYIRTVDLKGVYNFNLDTRIGYYYDETWFRITVRAPVPVSSGKWEFLNIDLHTETNAKIEDSLLMIGDIKITQTDPQGIPIPKVVNAKKYLEVEPIRKKYNKDNGYFMMGTIGTGITEPDSLRGRHFEIFVDENKLKPEMHLRPPKWLRDEYPYFVFLPDDEGPEWEFPTDSHLGVRDSGKPGEYKLHGHTLSWSDQSPEWMKQIIPENITSMEWNKKGYFYSGGARASGPFVKVKKETARRIYFDQTMNVMRHFMTVDARYGSSEKRGIIPFHSFDIINVEIHESQHSVIIQNEPNEWKNAVKNTSWLMALTDIDFDDVRQHYIYLLFKYAHIAIPNAKMAEKYKAGYNNPDIVPDYMKIDGHDNNGSIDAYISEKPPILVLNDFDFIVLTKAKVAVNMIKEINTAWKSDALYDGRNLIECIGIQGHETVSQTVASNSQRALALFAKLVDEGFLDCICYSEMDMKQDDYAPGGGARAPEILNQKQADAIGYQYALLFKLFEKYKKYIDHVIFWSQSGASWLYSYVLFDHEQKASQAYYGIMDTDRFIKGHSYLDGFFEKEYDKVKD